MGWLLSRDRSGRYGSSLGLWRTSAHLLVLLCFLILSEMWVSSGCIGRGPFQPRLFWDSAWRDAKSWCSHAHPSWCPVFSPPFPSMHRAQRLHSLCPLQGVVAGWNTWHQPAKCLAQHREGPREGPACCMGQYTRSSSWAAPPMALGRSPEQQPGGWIVAGLLTQLWHPQEQGGGGFVMVLVPHKQQQRAPMTARSLRLGGFVFNLLFKHHFLSADPH